MEQRTLPTPLESTSDSTYSFGALPQSNPSLSLRRSLAPLGINFALAALSGVLFALSFPDFAIGWLAFVALIPLFVALGRARSGWDAFFLGWISQTVAWLIMVPWVVRVMSHY